MARKNIAQDEFRLLPEHKEKTTGPSLTVPDETLSIKEIVEKHVRGQRIADQLMRTPIYDSGADFDSDDLEKVKQMDLVEQDEIYERNAEKIAEIKEKQKKLFSKKKEEKAPPRQGEPRSPTEEPEPDPAATTKKPTKEAPKKEEPDQ